MPPNQILIVDDSSTIRKLVSAILSAHDYACLTASDGAEALEVLERESVDLVLLDFVMPRMNGYTFCRELRANEQTRQIPVVLMSAKAEHIREQFIKQTGALDAITKPFHSRALIAVVEGALQRSSAGQARPLPNADDMIEEDLLEEVPESDQERSSALPPQTEREHLEAFVTKLSRRLGDELEKISDRLQPASELLEQLRDCVTPERIEQLVAEIVPSSIVQTPGQSLYGNVAHIPLGEILQLLGMQQAGGRLLVAKSKRSVEIFLSGGRVELAQSRPSAPEFLLGRYLVEEKAIDKERLEQAIIDAKEHRKLLGRWLLDNEIVSEEAVHRALVRQSSEIIYDVLRWRTGWFSLERGALPPEAELAHLGLSVSSLILEGFRRVDEWQVIEEKIHFDDVLFRDEAAIGTTEPGDLSEQHKALLELIDGQRTVREIIDASHQSSFDVCKTLYQLLQSRLVREVSEDGR